MSTANFVDPHKLPLLVFGALFALLGVLLMLRQPNDQEGGVVDFFGFFKLQLASAGLVVFITGTAVFTYPYWAAFAPLSPRQLPPSPLDSPGAPRDVETSIAMPESIGEADPTAAGQDPAPAPPTPINPPDYSKTPLFRAFSGIVPGETTVERYLQERTEDARSHIERVRFGDLQHIGLNGEFDTHSFRALRSLPYGSVITSIFGDGIVVGIRAWYSCEEEACRSQCDEFENVMKRLYSETFSSAMRLPQSNQIVGEIDRFIYVMRSSKSEVEIRSPIPYNTVYPSMCAPGDHYYQPGDRSTRRAICMRNEFRSCDGRFTIAER